MSGKIISATILAVAVGVLAVQAVNAIETKENRSDGVCETTDFADAKDSGTNKTSYDEKNLTDDDSKTINLSGVKENITDEASYSEENPDESIFEAFDPVDNRISYAVDFSDGNISYDKIANLAYEYTFEDSTASLEYLRDFFENGGLPVDEAYKEGFKRNVYTGTYSCKVSPNAKAYSPVDGKVVAVGYYESLGNSVAVEFGDKVFIAAHLDEASVKVGEKLSAGQSLGVCGASGAVSTEESPMLSLITMQKK